MEDRRRIPSTAPTIPPIMPDLFELFSMESPFDGTPVGWRVELEFDEEVLPVDDVRAAEDVAGL